MILLEIRKMTKYFGGLAAVGDFDLDVRSGEILGLIGPNGAGKTTVFNLIAGVYSPTRGRVIFEGKEITGSKPNLITQKGIARTFQLVTLFDTKTILENMVIAFHLESKSSFVESILNSPSIRTRERDILRKAGELLELVGLTKDMSLKRAGSLPHGHRKFLGVAMALATSPKLLLLDEPVGGMNAEEAGNMMSLIKMLKEGGLQFYL